MKNLIKCLVWVLLPQIVFSQKAIKIKAVHDVYITMQDTVFKKGNKIVLPALQWDFDNGKLTQVAKDSLQRVVKFLLKNKGLNVEIGTHTDMRGNPLYNQKLSLARADQIRRLFIESGIWGYRMEIKGYGATEPRSPEMTEDGYTSNRRSELKIINENYHPIWCNNIKDDYSKVVKNPIVLPKISFELGKDILTKAGNDSLDLVVTFLKKYYTWIVEIIDYTDGEGSKYHTVNLYQKRAVACVNYLISKGIDSRRLIPKGKGDLEPRNFIDEAGKSFLSLTQDYIKGMPKEQQEEAHALNRRTELKVLRTDFTPAHK